MLIGETMLGTGAEGEVYRCASLDNSHTCAIKWSAYEHVTIKEPRLVHLISFYMYVSAL